MINLYRSTNTEIFCTPLENTDSDYSIFYFKFTSRLTQNIVECWLVNLSLSARYQQFEILVNDYFANEEDGFYTYEIKGADDYDVVPTGYVLESGYMNLHPASNFVPEYYNEQVNNFKTYNGQ